jgi:hypothetical protein
MKKISSYLIVLTLVSLNISLTTISCFGTSNSVPTKKAFGEIPYAKILYVSGPNDVAEIELALNSDLSFELHITDIADGTKTTTRGTYIDTDINHILQFNSEINLDAFIQDENEGNVAVISDSKLAINKEATEIYIYGLACTRY